MEDYQEGYRTFQLEVPDHYNFGLDTVDRWADEAAKPALFWVGDDGSERQITFAELRDSSAV